MRGDTGVFGKESGFPDLLGDPSEAVDELCRVGNTTLVGGRVDAGNGGADDGIVSRDFLKSGELSNKGRGYDLVLQGRLDSLDGDDQVLRLEIGIDDLVPLGRQLLQLRDGRRQFVELACHLLRFLPYYRT